MKIHGNNTFIHDVAYKTLNGEKLLHILFKKLEYPSTVYPSSLYRSTKYLALFRFNEKYEKTFHRTRNLTMLKSNNLGFYSHKYIKIKINLDDKLSLEKTSNMHNLVKGIKS